MRVSWSRARRRVGNLIASLRSPGEAVTCLGIGLFAVVVPLLLRLPLPRLERMLARRSRRMAADAESIARRLELIDLTLAAGRPLLRPGCLVRGLTAYRSLGQLGGDVSLHFGIAQGDDRTSGHCCLEKAGEPLGEREDPRHAFMETYVMPARPLAD